MLKFAIVKNAKVRNIVIASRHFGNARGWVEIPEEVGIDWTYDGTTFSPPARNINKEVRDIKKNIRDELRETAWVIADDVETSASKASWLNYRASLRTALKSDINPDTFVMPVAPGVDPE